jgi:hypothetical protein
MYLIFCSRPFNNSDWHFLVSEGDRDRPEGGRGQYFRSALSVWVLISLLHVVPTGNVTSHLMSKAISVALSNLLTLPTGQTYINTGE